MSENVAKPKQEKLVSLVIPCYNEEKNIERYEAELIPVLEDLPYDYEAILVDDGSTKDDTWGAIKRLSEKFDTVTGLKHSRNYGMGAAYQTGFDHSKGDYVVVYSSDLEIPPVEIARVVAKMDEGFDLVNTHRVGRWSEGGGLASAIRRVPSKIANGLIKRISGVEMHDTGSGLKGFKRFIIENLRIYGDMHRFLPAYAGLYTKNFCEFEVEYQERTYGESAYGSLMRTFSVFLDLFTMKFMLSFATKPFTMMPGRLFGSTGLVSFSVGFVATLYALFLKFGLGQPIGQRPLFIGGLLLTVFGMQLIMTGLLGELMMRTYFESSHKTPYIVSEEA
ncbi:glycosyltransferase [candidate division WWE3 bacterium]|nr:glycosyltransferase [candidate division WWE3 bacterium]